MSDRRAPSPANVVPAGHSVTIYGRTPEPGVADAAGAILANFGYGGDDVAELHALFNEVDAAGRSARPCRFVSVRSDVSELFLPNQPAVSEATAALFWLVAGEGVPLLDDKACADAFVACVRRFTARPGICQSFVVTPEWRGPPALLNALRSSGVTIFECADQDPVLAAVTRPSGATILGLAAKALTRTPSASGRWQLVRAPLLRRLLLAAGERASTQALHEELRRRQFGLLFIVEHGRPVLQQWAGSVVGWPVFADLRSLLRAAGETGKKPGSFAVGELPVGELFQAAIANRLPLAMNAYPDAGAARYLMLDVPTMTALLG
jgi:hypothetical protein